jgi:hypothetical protein
VEELDWPERLDEVLCELAGQLPEQGFVPESEPTLQPPNSAAMSKQTPRRLTFASIVHPRARWHSFDGRSKQQGARALFV